jgi:uncharacterized delta-60 repeat protein
MRTRNRRTNRIILVEHLEDRSLLSGGPQAHGPLAPGSLTPGFGSGGIATASPILGPTSDSASGVAIQQQSDGKIVVAGTSRGVESQSDFALARYNVDGSLDTRFGNGGTAFTDFASGSVTASAVAIEPDGKIIVAGTIQISTIDGSSEEFALARYNKDGSLDTKFGTGGEVLTGFGPDSFSSATSIAIARDGRIIVAGTSTIGGTNNFAVARYNTDGSLDTKFGTGGESTTNFGPGTGVFTENGVAIQPNGQIVLAGTVANFTGTFTEDFGLARFNSNGILDQGFGTGGLVTTGFGTSNAFSVAGIALEPGTNAIVVAGTVNDPSFTQDFALVRYKASNGSLDTSFGTGGEVITASAPSTTSSAAGIAIQPNNGAIVVTGTTSGFDSNSNFFEDLTLARYRASNGSLDTSFGAGGEVLTGFGPGSRTTASGVAIQADGKIVAAGSVSFTSGGTVAGFAVARYLSSGSLDRSFGKGGEVITNVPGPSSDVAAGEAIQADGKIVVVGTASVFGPDGAIDQDFALTRFNSDGSVDTHFGNNGSVLTDFGTGTNQAVAVTIQADGKIVVVGTIQGSINGEFVQDIGLARYNTDGSLDKSFGTGGEMLVDFGPDTEATAAGVALQANGKLVVSGTASGFDSEDNFFQDFALARFNTNGKLDTSFGTGGEVLTSFGPDTSVTAAGVAIQSNGRIVVVGSATDPDTFNNDFALARYNTNGSLDTSFGTGGEVTTSFGPDTSDSAVGVVIQPNGKIVVAGTDQDFDNDLTEFALARYNTNGSLDTSFGTGGEVTTSFGPNGASFAAGVALEPNGEIVVAGTDQDFSTGLIDFALAEYNADGSLDQGFGTGGLVLTNLGPGVSGNPAGVAIASDGEIIVVGTATDNFMSDFTLASYVGKKARGRG